MTGPLHPGRPTGAGSLDQLAAVLDRRDAAVGVTVAATLACEVTIGPAGGARSFDTERGQTVTAPGTPVYTGPAGIGPASATSAGADLVTAEDLVAERLYEVELPLTVDGNPVDTSQFAVDHVVVVTAATDPRLAGARLVVKGFEDADRAWSRVIYAIRTDG